MTDRPMRLLLDLGEVPFHVGVKEKPTNALFPDTFPFQVGWDEELQLIRQMPNAQVEELLRRTYQLGSQIGTPMSESGLGQRYAEDFLSFILDQVGDDDLSGLDVLEIGSGKGYLLKRLKEKGANVVGVEPGVDSSLYAEEEGIEVLKEEFDPGRFHQPFDLIINYAVLEHIDDPLRFIQQEFSILKPGGELIFSVPDCTEFLQHGDLSIFIHEHWSYFTRDSLSHLAQAAGADVLSCRRGNVGGALHSAWKRGTSSVKRLPVKGRDLEDLVYKTQQGTSLLEDYIRSVCDAGRSLGIYCPARFINYYPLIRGLSNVRFFDDDPHLTGKYIPPIPIPIEARPTLIRNPVDDLLIMSRAFGPRIQESLEEYKELEACHILQIGDLQRFAS